jgi:uncharacterized protein YhaN
MKADALTFAVEAAAVAQALGMDSNGKNPLDLVRDAKARLGQAEVSQARRKTLQDDAAARRADAEAAQAALDAAEVALADARRLTATSDRVALAAALDGSRRRREVEAAVATLEQEIRIDSDGHPLAELEAACAAETPETLAERAVECARNADELAQRAQEAGERAAEAQLRFDQLDSGASAADAAADAEQARSEMEALAEIYLLKCAEHVLLDYAMRRQAERRRNPMLLRAAALFKTLTLGRYSDLRADYDSEKPRLIGLCADGATTVAVSDMSEGTQDQLFLALRLAAVEQGLEAGVRLPFIADDLFVTFDDDRARAGLEVLGELSRSTQVLFFTHHAHLRALAQDVFGSHALSTSDLSDAV